MEEIDKIYDFAIIGDGITAGIMKSMAKSTKSKYVCFTNGKTINNRKDPRSLALSTSTIKIFNTLGIELKAQKVKKMSIYEGGLGSIREKSKLVFDMKDNDGDYLSYIVKRNEILEILGKNVRKGHARKISDILSIKKDNKKIFINMNNGEVISSKLLIFTNKLENKFQKILKLSYREKHYDQHAIVATLLHEKSHKGEASQFFIKGGPFALLPLLSEKKKNLTSLIWTNPSSTANELIKSPQMIISRLNELCKNKLGLVKIIEGPKSFPLIKYTLSGNSDDRLIFAGDSIRSMHPLLGQAWNQAIRDLAYISDAFMESQRLATEVISVPSFRAYKRIRLIEGLVMVNASDLINNIYESDGPLLKGLRRNAMNIINKVDPVKKLLIKEASGGILKRPSLGKTFSVKMKND